MVAEQYAIVLVNLSPTIGSEISKTRPCVIASPIEMNRNLRTVIVIPMTTSPKKYPTRVEVNFQQKKGYMAVDQIKTIDATRIKSLLGHLSKREISALKSVIRQTLVD